MRLDLWLALPVLYFLFTFRQPNHINNEATCTANNSRDCWHGRTGRARGLLSTVQADIPRTFQLPSARSLLVSSTELSSLFVWFPMATCSPANKGQPPRNRPAAAGLTCRVHVESTGRSLTCRVSYCQYQLTTQRRRRLRGWGWILVSIKTRRERLNHENYDGFLLDFYLILFSRVQ